MKKIAKILPVLAVGLIISFSIVHFTTEKIQDEYFRIGAIKRPNNGVYKEFHQNGHLYSVEHYKNGRKEGKWRYYYESGVKKSEISYKNDLLNGYLRHYSESGDLIFVERYRDDQLVHKTIINDSLYKYEIVLTSHGKEMFQTNCTPCHAPSEVDSLQIGLKDVPLFVDSNGITFLSIDSLHTINADTMDIKIAIGEKVEIGPVQKPQLQKYDIEAIIDFLEKEKTKTRFSKKKKFRKLRLRKKVV